MNETEKELAKAKVTKINSYLEVFDNDEGKSVILDLMEKGHILTPTTGSSDRESILNEGKRELVLYILDMITYNVDDIMNLIGNKEKKNTNNSSGGKNEELYDFFGDEA